ncbi:gentisate 1,2-dioxygenase [Streptomyces collinus]|uniref:Gentisate 1,2-dioxygenase n=1 Tax=Streptomyces collinus TaxID=42684 RepID=A0AA89Q865_STRCU|nr:gentisate 1,2-dioxygenase [Streptomyces collinus]
MTDAADDLIERKMLDDLYADFEDAGLIPLWTQLDGLMPATPQPAAVPHLWR